MESEIKKAFISYAWDNEEHKNWVLKLASDLRHHGIDAILDQWDARLGNDLSFFMEQGLTTSHFVLCVCSDKYIEKANGGIGGAGYEKRILAAEMMDNDDKRFIIPVIKRNFQVRKLPTFLSGLKYVDFDNGQYYDNYQELLERIYDEDIKKKPPLGSNPFISSIISDQITTKLSIEQIEFQNPVFEGKASFDYKRNSGSYTIGEVIIYLLLIGVNVGIILFIVIEITYIDWDIILIILNFRLLTSLLILILVHGLSLLTLGKLCCWRIAIINLLHLELQEW